MAYTTINKPSLYFDTQLWTGNNGNGRTFTGLNFRPDFIYNKCYNSSNYYLNMIDIVRGGTKFLATPVNSVEDTASHGQITSWNSDGTTWADGTNATYPRLYYNDGVGSTLGGSEYVSWNWLAGGTGVSNTAGTISSTVSANTTSGFSIVSYTGNGAAATIGHGLGVAPKAIIVKSRSNAVDWVNYFSVLGTDKFLKLNLTDAAGTSTGVWNNTAPTSSVFSVNSSGTNNDPGVTYIAYCFAEVKGFSKFGSFTGNGSDNGAFVYTGFKPAYVMMKSSSTGGAGYNWGIFDNKRLGYNVDNNDLRANLPNAEGTDNSLDLLSNGFKIRSSSGGFGGGSGVTYIYMAFAENPFVSSTFIPTTAR